MQSQSNGEIAFDTTEDRSMDDDGMCVMYFFFQGSYDTELQALHELIQRKVVTLLSDPENIVKQTLLENGITQLCVFFGRQKANDVLLSHMITFLNDKQDWQLRGAFFDSIVGVAAYVGWQSLVMLRPLLEQVPLKIIKPQLHVRFFVCTGDAIS